MEIEIVPLAKSFYIDSRVFRGTHSDYTYIDHSSPKKKVYKLSKKVLLWGNILSDVDI